MGTLQKTGKPNTLPKRNKIRHTIVLPPAITALAKDTMVLRAYTEFSGYVEDLIRRDAEETRRNEWRNLHAGKRKAP